MTVPSTAGAVRPQVRRVAVVGGIWVGFVLLGLLVARLTILSGPTLGWQLGYLHGGVPFNAEASQAMTVVPVQVPWFDCDTEVRPGFMPSYITPRREWVQPEITYTPLSVTITIRADPAYYAMECPPDSAWRSFHHSVPVQLSEPLAGRTLFDGSTLPPSARTQTVPGGDPGPAAEPAFQAPDIGAILRGLPLDDPVVLFVGFMVLVVLWEIRWIVPWGLRRIDRMARP